MGLNILCNQDGIRKLPLLVVLLLLIPIGFCYWMAFRSWVKQEEQQQKEEQQQQQQEPSQVIGQFESISNIPSQSSLQLNKKIQEIRNSIDSQIKKNQLYKSNHSNNQINAKPNLILHIGMHKGGSTYIQSMGSIFEEDFQLDNYAFYGPIYSRVTSNVYMYDCPDFFKESVDVVRLVDYDASNCPFSREFIHFAQEFRDRNVNLFLSEERFESNDFTKKAEKFRNLFVDMLGFETRVVFVHRPMYERYVSWYNQMIKRALTRHDLLPWPETDNNCTFYDREISCKYPPPLPSLVQYYREKGYCLKSTPNCPDQFKLLAAAYSNGFSFYTIPLKEADTSPLITTTMTQAEYDNKTKNNNNDDDIMTRLVCNIVPHANHTCSVMKDLTLFQDRISKKKIRSNPSLELDYDRIAVRAYQAGLIHQKEKGPTRKFVFDAIKKYVEQKQQATVKELCPLVCLDRNETEFMYKNSLEIESYLREFSYLTLSPSSSSPESLSSSSAAAAASPVFNQTRFREVFDDFLSKKALCSVDVDKTINDPKWIHFFQSL